PGVGPGEARTDQGRPGSPGRVASQDVTITIPFPVPFGWIKPSSARDGAGTSAQTSATGLRISGPADRSCLRSRASRPGRYFRWTGRRGNMELPLGVRPDGARTVHDLRGAFGWVRARPWMAAAGVLPHPGAPRRIPILQDECGVRSPPRWG